MPTIEIDSIETAAPIAALHKHNSLVHAAFAWDDDSQSDDSQSDDSQSDD
ncbi:MAG: hypothetical protein ACK5RL_12425 [Acidimicrobiales bacterium]